METEERASVFVSPPDIEFPLSERSPRQIVTIYNPYNYHVIYKVLCTVPEHYAISENKGVLSSNCCKDIVVRCKTRLPIGTIDKLRVEIRKSTDPSVVHGHRDLMLRTVMDRSVDQSSSQFHGFSDSISGAQQPTSRDQTTIASRTRKSNVQEGINTGAWCVLAGICCALALLLPTCGDPAAGNSPIPASFHLTMPQKLVAAYILGIITILILKPS